MERKFDYFREFWLSTTTLVMDYMSDYWIVGKSDDYGQVLCYSFGMNKLI